MEEFVACFAEVVDPRRDNARHNLHELLMIALCTMLSGGKDCSDMALFGQIKEPFLRQFLRLRHGTPSHDTFSRVFRLLDPKAFEAWQAPHQALSMENSIRRSASSQPRTTRFNGHSGPIPHRSSCPSPVT